MAQYEYKPRKIPQTLSIDWWNQELAIIADRHNYHYYQSFPDRCVALFAMKQQYGIFGGIIQSPSTVTGTSETLYLPISVACTLTRYSFTCHAITGTPTFQFQYSSTRNPINWSSVCAATTIGSAYGTDAGAVSIALVAGDCIRMVINGSSGDVTRGTGTLCFKAKHTI